MSNQNETTVFIDPFADWAFKRLFASEESKPILIGLLNHIFKGKKCITAIEYGKTDHPGEHAEEGGAVFDITCTDADGTKFIIEIQRGWQENYKNLTREEREMYNASMKYKWDNQNVRDYAAKKGREEGLERGLQEGLQQGLQEGLQQGLQEGLQQGLQEGLQQGLEAGERKKAVEMARKMLLAKEPLEKITEYSGLSIEEIQSL